MNIFGFFIIIFVVYNWLGVNFMEKTISIRQTEITFSIWDLGGPFLIFNSISDYLVYIMLQVNVNSLICYL